MPNATTIAATIRADGSATLEIDGQSETVGTTRREDARREIVHRASRHAAQLGSPVLVAVTEPDEAVQLLVAADGSVTVVEQPQPIPGVPQPLPAASRQTDASAQPTAASETPEPKPAAGTLEPVGGLPEPAAGAASTPLVDAGDVPAPTAAGRPVPAASAPAPGPAGAGRTPAPAGATPAPVPVPGGAGRAPAPRAGTPTPAPVPAGGAAAPFPASTPAAESRALAAAASAAAGPRTEIHPSAEAAEPLRRRERPSFLQHEQEERPAAKGWRGALVRAGIRVPPSARERAERADLHAVSQHWPGPRTIAVVNGKGGAGKTPTSINLAAVFARHGGAGVLAWDNNQTRGTLGWRTEQGPHDATLLELLPETGRLLGTSAQSADLARFVHHQTADKFDVLRSKPAVLASEQRITAADVSSIHSVAAKYYRLIVIDSGNDETDPLWLQMIDHADQLVVATTTRDDHAEAGALLLEGLAERDERSARLAENAVAVVTQADSKATDADIRHVADGFSEIAREVVTIPFDPALVDGIITYEALRPDTRRAWLAAAAAIARGL